MTLKVVVKVAVMRWLRVMEREGETDGVAVEVRDSACVTVDLLKDRGVSVAEAVAVSRGDEVSVRVPDGVPVSEKEGRAVGVLLQETETDEGVADAVRTADPVAVPVPEAVRDPVDVREWESVAEKVAEACGVAVSVLEGEYEGEAVGEREEDRVCNALAEGLEVGLELEVMRGERVRERDRVGPVAVQVTVPDAVADVVGACVGVFDSEVDALKE